MPLNKQKRSDLFSYIKLKNHTQRVSFVFMSILKYMRTIAKEQSITKIKQSSQEHAVEFYKKYGFSVTSERYLNAGIPHYNMPYRG